MCDFERFKALEHFSRNYFLPESGIGFISSIRLERELYMALISKELDIDVIRSHRISGYEHFYDSDLFPISIEISGCWQPNGFFVDYSNSSDIQLVVDSMNSFVDEASDFYFKYNYEISLNQFITADNVLLHRQDVLLLAEHLRCNKGFNLGLQQSSHAKEKSNESVFTPRVTASQASMIKTLLHLIPEIDKELFETSHKLHTKLQELCKVKRIPYTVNDGKTIKNWLDKAQT
jgi:hypothetical protein